MSNHGKKIPKEFTLKFAASDGRFVGIFIIFDDGSTEEVERSEIPLLEHLGGSNQLLSPQLLQFIDKPGKSICCIIFNNIPYCWC